MALPLVTAAVALFYLGAIPLEIAVCLRADGNFGFGAGFSLFVPDAALRRALLKTAEKAPPPRFLKRMSLPEKLRLAKRSWSLIHAHLHLEEVRLAGSLGTGDAASTALICGSVSALARMLQGITGRPVVCRLNPDFSGGGLRADLSGMISVRIGHIMLAALLGLIDYATGRLYPWKSTPLKAS